MNNKLVKGMLAGIHARRSLYRMNTANQIQRIDNK